MPKLIKSCWLKCCLKRLPKNSITNADEKDIKAAIAVSIFGRASVHLQCKDELRLTGYKFYNRYMGALFENKVDLLQVKVFASRADMGSAAGYDVASRIKQLHEQQDIVRIIFAAAPSQNEVLAFLTAEQGIDWSRVDVFHMDEYIGLPKNASQRFSSFLVNSLFDKVKPRRVHLIDDQEGLQAACVRYSALLNEAPIDIVCLGIGENGHIAFNDPPVADFNDTTTIKPVELDEACRQQQVNDGCFLSFDAVPEQALTLTIPALMAGKYLYCVVPGKTKSDAIRNVLTGKISTACPASILRTHKACVLYTDQDAYSLVAN